MNVWKGLRRWVTTSGMLAFTLSPRLRARPHSLYRTFRDLDAVHDSPTGIWVVTGHAAVAAALRNPLLGSDEAKAAPMTLPPLLAPLERFVGSSAESRGGPATRVMERFMLFQDAPDHTRLRSLVNKAFTPRAVEALAPRIAEIIDEHLDRLVGRGHMELLRDFAYPVPALVICELLGAPLPDHTLITKHAPAIATRLDPSPMRNASVELAADAAVTELGQYLDTLIETKRRSPGPDLVSALLAAQDDGDRLSHDEIVSTLILLLIAGHETTANLLGNGLYALLTRPEHWNRYCNDPTLDRTAIEELLRYDGPIQMVERIALDDVDIAGHRVPKGKIVVLFPAAANRDPDVFDKPDDIDLGRNPNPHVGFGGGAHFCIGAPLARLEARVALRSIANRLPGLRIGHPRPTWRPTFTIRGLNALPLDWTTSGNRTQPTASADVTVPERPTTSIT